MKKNYLFEKSMEVLFLICTLISVISIILICYFIFEGGLPFISRYGFFNFIFGTKWAPTNTTPNFGILPMIMGSIEITLFSAIIGVPIGIMTATYLAIDCDKKLYKFLKPLVNLMAGVPSIVYGLFALIVLVPVIRSLFGGTGMSILTASILLGIMILPTIINLSESAIRAVPKSYYEASVALGATHERSVMKVILPAAKSGIMASVILGVGRAIGETMAVILVTGNQPKMNFNPLKGVRTLTTNVVMDMAYAAGDHMEALVATACILFIFILIINFGFHVFNKRSGQGE